MGYSDAGAFCLVLGMHVLLCACRAYASLTTEMSIGSHPINQSIKQTKKQSTKQSIKQSTKKSNKAISKIGNQLNNQANTKKKKK